MDYEVLRDGFIEATFRKKGDVIKGTKSSMRYLVLSGQVMEKQADLEPAPAPTAEEEATPAEQGGGRGGKRR